MLFLIISNVNIEFDIICFTWSFYSVIETLPTAKQVELFDKYKFAKAALDKTSKKFVMYIVALEVLNSTILVYPSQTLLFAALK